MDKIWLSWWFYLSDGGCKIPGPLSCKRGVRLAGSVLISSCQYNLSPLQKPQVSAHYLVEEGLGIAPSWHFPYSTRILLFDTNTN